MILTGFFDNLMVAKLGYTELAAAGICNNIFFLIAVFPMGVTIAFSTIISILEGKGRINSGKLLFRDAGIITFYLSIFTTAILLLAIYFFPSFGQTAEVNVLSIPYLKLLTISLTPMLFFFFVKNICDGYHYTSAGMIITLLTLVLNVFLNWILIYGNMGSPAFGLNGAGYATIISRFVSFIGVSYLLFNKPNIPINFSAIRSALKTQLHYRFYGQILRLGIPSGLQYFFEIAAFALAAIMAGWMGAKELAAHQLAITIAALTYMFASGLSTGTSISISKAYGKKQFSEIRLFAKTSLYLSSILMICFALLFLVFNEGLAKMFSDNTDVVLLGSQLLIIAAVFQLGDGIQAVCVGLLRGIEDVKVPSFITLFAYWGIAIPSAYFLGFEQNFGVRGIWFGLSLGLSASAVLLCIRFYKLLKLKQS